LASPIIETVVTTINPDGSVNCGAMGVEWGEQRIVVKPYRGTRTLRNLRATGAAVVNVTDDILLFCQAALGDPHPPTGPATSIEGAVLEDACFNRASHAVLEASILASRVRLLGDVHEELDRLQVLVDKTAGPREREAMDYVRAVIA
jgi:uncharacterized protein